MINLGLYYGKSKGEIITDHKTVGAFVTEAAGLFPSVRIVINENQIFEFRDLVKTNIYDDTEIESARYEILHFVSDGIGLEIKIKTKPVTKYREFQGWVNIYRKSDGKPTVGDLHTSREQAEGAIHGSQMERVDTVRIEWKEEIK